MKGNISWDWPSAGFGAAMSIVAGLLILNGEVLNGIALMLGSIPAAVTGLGPTKKDRKTVLLVGLTFSVSILLGSILAVWPPLAVVGMFALGYGAVMLAADKPLGLLVLSVALPLTGIGLTYSGVFDSWTIVLLMAAGTVGSYLWALVLPEYKGELPKKYLLPKGEARHYALSMAIAAAISTAVAFAMDISFEGWLVGSTLLVMRPRREMLSLRGVGRLISVLIGAIFAALMLEADLGLGAIAIISSAVLIAMSATYASRWYVTPAFTSFLILWGVLYGSSTSAEIASTSGERIYTTIVGVAIAYLVGALVPALAVPKANSGDSPKNGKSER